MKMVQAIATAVVGGFVLALAAGVQAQPGPQPGYATIVRIQGEARYSAGDNVWHPLTVGQTLAAGNVIQTAANSKVDLILGSKIPEHLVPVPDRVALASDGAVRDMVSYKAVAKQNAIRMEANTVLAIDTLTISDTGVDAVSNTELDLRQGTIFGTVKKLSATSQYLIKTPNGIAGVRGTTFIISANGDITVIDGSMVASHTEPDGHVVTVTLGPGDQYDPATGQVTKLTPQEFENNLKTAIAIITLEEGIISFANDETIIYVSPVRGGGPGHHGHWFWPF